MVNNWIGKADFDKPHTPNKSGLNIVFLYINLSVNLLTCLMWISHCCQILKLWYEFGSEQKIRLQDSLHFFSFSFSDSARNVISKL